MPEIRFIAAIDDKRGLAKKQKIPWDLPTDKKYFRDKLATGPVVMGYKTYVSNGRKPYGTFENTVFSRQDISLDNAAVHRDAEKFFKNLDYDVWVAGGGEIFAAALPFATILYITRVIGDFDCDVFFPRYEDGFRLESAGPWQAENGIRFRFEIWAPK